MTQSVDPNEVNEFQRMIAIMNGQTPPPVQRQTPSGRVVESSAGGDDGTAAMKDILLAMYGAAPELAKAGRDPRVSLDEGEYDPVGAAYQREAMDEGFGGALEFDENGEVIERNAPRPAHNPKQYDPAQFLTARAENDRELREALMTSATEDGVRIGTYKIIVQEDDRGLKSYDIMNAKTSETIAAELSLYEAARGIVRHLNNGAMINNAKVREIMQCEAEYARARQNAAEYLQRARLYESKGDGYRQQSMEARLSDSLGKAKAARGRVEKLTK